MKKILNTFKNLYAGEDVVKKHLIFAALFILPSFATATFQMIDKDEKAMIVPLLILGAVFMILSIIPLLMLSGVFLKFLNRNFAGQSGLPEFSMDVLIQGVRVIPVYIVWCLYIGVPVFIYVFSVIAGFGFILAGDGGSLTKVLSVFALFGLLFLLFIPLFIINPFVTMVYIKYCSTFEYSGEIFNPLTPFRYMKKAFKDTMIVMLKYFAVSIVVSTAAQIIGLVIGLLLFVFIFIGALFAAGSESSTMNWAVVTPAIVIAGLFATVNGYAVQMVNFSLSDNLIEVYKEKIECSDTNKDEDTSSENS